MRRTRKRGGLLDFDAFSQEDPERGQAEKKPGPTARVHVRKTKTVYRRAFSELQLLNIMPSSLEDGTSYHVISGGDVDSLSFLAFVLRHHSLDYLLFSTWCMAQDDVLQLAEWVETEKLKRIDAYVGEIFPGSYAAEYARLCPLVRESGGRVAVFRNHAKVYAGCGDGFEFAIESSANINTNPRTEQTCLTVGRGIFQFYKDFYDDIVSFKRDFDDWAAWAPS